MPTVASIIAELKKKGKESKRKIYARHGMVTDNMFGVSVADLKVIAKTIKGQQALACELYATGNMDAMYLAGMVADGSKMTPKAIERVGRGRGEFADDFRIYGALGDSRKSTGAANWRCNGSSQKRNMSHRQAGVRYSGLSPQNLTTIWTLRKSKKLLGTVVKGIKSAQNRVRYTMNGL